MAFVVRRPGDRWEIRESYSTPAGPRARTLASFRVLTDDVIRRASAAGGQTLERQAIIRAARKAGAPIERAGTDSTAAALLRVLARGTPVSPGLGRLLHDHLERTTRRVHLVEDSVAEWIGASDRERGDALVDLLGLADRLPPPKRKALEFPIFR